MTETFDNKEFKTPKGRPLDINSIARNSVRELRGDAKRLETIARRISNKASNLRNDINTIMTFTINQKQDIQNFSNVENDIKQKLENARETTKIAKQMRNEAEILNNEIKVTKVDKSGNSEDFFRVNSSFGYGSFEITADLGEEYKPKKIITNEQRTQRAIDSLFNDKTADEIWEEIEEERDI